jgi:hypothetical protein
MSRLRLALQGGKLAFFTMIGWLAVQAAAWAEQPQPNAAGGDSTSYTMYYGLVILVIALGMLFVCRPARRRDRAKPEVYEEAKMGVKE